MATHLRGWARAIASSPLVTSLSAHLMLVRYLAVGGFVGAMDLGTLKLLLLAHVNLAVATTASYLVNGVGLHFTINKLVTFRNVERTTLHLQIRNYAIVTGLCYLTTLLIVEGFARHGLDPVLGKAVSILVNVPLAFLANRAFTFRRREPDRTGQGGT